ncbi:MAG: PQQ-like beta-propeller repeat protein [Armatimonadetes bacterium]|nr:PQQ-like beta-propeller repeat protein [Armatimonadota bacterium]
MKPLLSLGVLSLLAVSSQAQVHIGTGSAAGSVRAPWAMDHADPARTGRSLYPGPDLGLIDWKQRTGGSVPGIAADRSGRAVLGATFFDASWSNELYVQVLKPDGEVDWRRKVEPYAWGASQGVRSMPALMSGDRVVMNSGNGQLVGFDATGSLIATISGNANMTNDRAPAVLPNGDIVHLQSSLRRIRPDGSVVWTASAFSQTDPAVAKNGDVAIGGVRTNEPHGSTDVSYYDSNGSLRWQKTSTKGTRTQVCFGPDGTLYTTVGGTTAYRADGTVKWNATNGGWGVCLDGLGRALVPQGNRVFAYDKDDGTLVWTATLPFVGNIVEGLSIDVRSRIYVSSSDGVVACLKPDGTLAWSLKVADQLVTQPALSTDGSAFVSGFFNYQLNYVFRIK